MNDNRDERAGLSRRAFLKGSGLTAAATALAAGPAELLGQAAAGTADQAGQLAGYGPAAVRCELTVNGAKYTTSIEPRVTLLDALRNYLDITGAKRVCDRGTCGACTVIVDGRAIYSCSTLALEAQGKKIETPEALAGEGTVHPVPAAFAQYDAQQCGFCTPGFVMAMKACFDKHPNATPAQVEECLAGNICRCGTYQQMRDALRSLCQGKAGAEKKGG
jgi:xanthine dehydrogenase YagT iron-sulfur-binding subunit